MDITQLVSRAQQGDGPATGDLLRRASQLVYARVLQSLKGQAAADDVAQDALLAALAGLPRLREPKAFLAWLRRITDNTVANHLAHRRREASEAQE